MDSCDKYASGIKSLSNCVGVVPDIGIAAAVNREDWGAKAGCSVRIKIGHNNSTIDVAITVAVPVEGAIAKHENHTFEIGLAVGNEWPGHNQESTPLVTCAQVHRSASVVVYEGGQRGATCS